MTEVADQFTEERSGEVTRIATGSAASAVEGTSGRSGPVYNPATGEQTGEVDFATRRGGRRGGRRPRRRAFRAWRTISLVAPHGALLPHPRARPRAPRGDRTHPDARARQGALRRDGRGRARARGDRVRCGIPDAARRAASRSRPRPGSTSTRSASRSASSAGITPFNFPAMVPMWMWAPAIACGNTFVLKPSEKDPSASMLHGRAAEGGRPPGRRLQRRARRQGRGRRACSSTRTSRRSRFVGSTPIARYVYETGTKHGKRVQALGGAKNHMIVLPDADIDMAADAAVSAALRLGGRALHGGLAWSSRVGDAADELVEAIKERLPKVKVGNGLEPDSEMGPLVTREHRDKVASYIDKGARGGRDGRRRRPRDGARRRRLLPRRVAARRRHARDGRLQGRDLRPGARGHARRHLRRGRASS